jgi:predicted nucleic acid-binding protein
MTRTFVDAGVLIVAARGKGDIAVRALEVLDDPNREFASSPFLQLEVLPKAVFNKMADEVAFYEEFFKQVAHWADDLNQIVQDAHQEACTAGVGPFDSLHVAAAALVGAAELITSEKPEKSIYRAKCVPVVSIRPTDATESSKP